MNKKRQKNEPGSRTKKHAKQKKETTMVNRDKSITSRKNREKNRFSSVLHKYKREK
jgi:hypothetical protein